MLRRKQRNEAILRMKKLNLSEDVINNYKREGKVNKSKIGRQQLELKPKEKEIIRKFQEDTGNLVYHVIPRDTAYERTLSIFYVSKDTEEWERDREDIKNNFSLVYIYNLEEEKFSKFEIIKLKERIGGLVRLD